jgi:hypothetical protein
MPGAVEFLGKPAWQCGGFADVVERGVGAVAGGGARGDDVAAVGADIDLPGWSSSSPAATFSVSLPAEAQPECQQREGPIGSFQLFCATSRATDRCLRLSRIGFLHRAAGVIADINSPWNETGFLG